MTKERPVGKHGCHARTKSGGVCNNGAIPGTRNCRMHPGKPLAKLRAEGQVRVELARWGLNAEEVRDPGETMLQLMTQSALRVELYSSLVGEAYAAAERLRELGDVGDQLPPHLDNSTDRERAFQDLARVFAQGGVSVLIGAKWSAAGKDGDLYQAEEAIRGLVQLEADERDRCATFAAKAIAAGLAERQVRVQEQIGAQVAEMIRGTLSDLGLDPAAPEVMRVVSARLQALAGGAAA